MSNTATPVTTGSNAQNVKITESLTEYVILRRERQIGDSIPVTSDGGVWVNSGNVKARNAEAAIRAHGQEGDYVAVSARFWNPTTVTSKPAPPVLELKPAN